MANFSVKASFDGSELVQGFKEVKTEINGLSNAGKSAQKSLGEMLQKKNSTSDYRRQLSLLSREITDLTVNYRRLSEAEQQSEFGVALKQKIDELTAKASEFKDAMLDVQQSINESASDTANWDAFQSLIDITSSSLQTFVGVTGMSEDSVEALTRTIAAMQTVGAAANTVIKVGNALQKTSALMLGVARVKNAAAAAAIRIKTAAEGKSVVVTKAATVAQKAFNVVAKANPYVLLATVILGVGAALVGFVKKTKDAEKAQEEYNKQLEEQKQKETERRQIIANSVGDQVSKFRLLQSEWSQLSSTQEKTKWITDNADAFSDLGLAIYDVASAQNVLIAKADAVVKALTLQAEAAALQEIYKQSYKEAYARARELDAEMTKITNNPVQAGYEVSGDEREKYNLGPGGIYTKKGNYFQSTTQKTYSRALGDYTTVTHWSDKLSSEGAAYVQQQKVDAVQAQKDVVYAEANSILKDLKDKQKEAKEAADAVAKYYKPQRGSGGGKGSGGGTQTVKTLKEEQAEFESHLGKLDKLYEEGRVSEEEYYRERASLANSYKSKLENLPSGIVGDVATEYDKATEIISKSNEELAKLGSFQAKIKAYADYNDELKRITELEKDGILSITESRQTELAAAKKYYNFLSSNYTTLSDNEKKLTRELKTQIDLFEQANDVEAKFKAEVITEGEAKEAIKTINAELAKLGLDPIEVDLTVNTTTTQTPTKVDQYNDKKSKIEDVRYQYEIGIVTAESAQETINKINSELRDLGLKPLEINIKGEKVLEQVNAWSDALSSLASIFTQVTSAINDENTALGAMCAGLSESEKSWLSWGASSMSTIAQTLPQIASLIVANQAAAMAQGTSSAAGLPFPANIAAIVSIIAMLVGIFASLPKFATGGIISGKNIGDMNLARVNGGEMILNGRQQKNLFNLIDHNRLSPSLGSSGEVTFRIQGDTLVGTLNNYYKKRGKA